MRQHTRPLAALATVLTGIGVGAFALAPAAHADTTTLTYFSSESEQTFAVPGNVNKVNVVAIGGRGGKSHNVIDPGDEVGGSGATMSADLPVTPGTTLYLEVGANGQDASGAD